MFILMFIPVEQESNAMAMGLKVHVQTFEVSKILFWKKLFSARMHQLVKSDRKDIYQIK